MVDCMVDFACGWSKYYGDCMVDFFNNFQGVVVECQSWNNLSTKGQGHSETQREQKFAKLCITQPGSSCVSCQLLCDTFTCGIVFRHYLHGETPEIRLRMACPVWRI